jgi:hypothetical protein
MLAGGVRILTKSLQATAGLVVQSNGQRYLITAGHAVGKQGSQVMDAGEDVVGVVESNYYAEGTTVDLALVKLDTGYKNYKLYAAVVTFGKNEQALITNLTVPEESGRAKKGAEVFMLSPSNGPQYGKILVPDVDVTAGERKQTNVCVANYPSQPSDSGAPVVSALSSNAVCFGFHGGRFKNDNTTLPWFTPLDNLDLDLD